jgi:hypothetical protein
MKLRNTLFIGRSQGCDSASMHSERVRARCMGLDLPALRAAQRRFHS